MTRREILRASGSVISAGWVGGCSSRRPPAASYPRTPMRRLVPVDCSQSRVIRTVAGLRPFRRSGYVVRSEQREGKTIIHNYGHGGAGITLSWGTAQLALEEAQHTPHREFAVLGCGVIGLSTARLFQRHGLRVTIYTKQMPPDTTSNVAGGFWSPVTLFEGGRQSPQFSASFVRAARFAHRYFQNLTNDDYGVHWRPFYFLSNDPPRPPSGQDPFPGIQQLFPDSQELQKNEHPFPTARARRRWSLLIEPPIYLNALLRDYQLAGGTVVIRDFGSLADILALPEPAVVNCTGLGAKALFADEELTPVKGQLSFLIPQPEVDYGTIGPGGLYMFPRKDGILLGGTHEEGVWDLEPDPSQSDRIVRGHAELFAGMR